MTIWRWQRDSEIAFHVPVKLGDNGRNYWWLPNVRAWMRRREERQAQAVRHLVIRGNGGESNNTDLPAGTSASAAPARQKPRPIGAAAAGRPALVASVVRRSMPRGLSPRNIRRRPRP
jgi:hypothetical protein